MKNELEEIYKSLSYAHAILLGMGNTLNQIFGRQNITEEDAVALQSKGERIEI